MAKKWYVVQTFAGFEHKVKESLLQRIKEYGKEAAFGEILIPTETVTETVQQKQRDGTERTVTRQKQKTSLPGYLFVEMEMTEDVWHLVKNTQKVSTFIGNQRPQEVRPQEIENQRRRSIDGVVKPKARLSLDVGDEIRVTEGPFANYLARVEEVMPEKQKLRVKVSIFGRETPVELDFSQVEKRVS